VLHSFPTRRSSDLYDCYASHGSVLGNGDCVARRAGIPVLEAEQREGGIADSVPSCARPVRVKDPDPHSRLLRRLGCRRLRLLEWLHGLSWLRRLSRLSWLGLVRKCARHSRHDSTSTLQRRLRGRIQQSAAIGGWVIDELPLVVMIFLVELADGLVFAGAGDTDDWPPTENLAR